MAEPGRVRTSVPLPKFSGKSCEWVRYWQKFEAFAKVNKFKRSVTKTLDTELPSREDKLSNDDLIKKKQEMAIERNDVAILFLTLSLQLESDLAMIEKSKTEAWPDGLAQSVVVVLPKKYYPDDIMTGVEFATELSNVNMGEQDSPANLFEQIATIRNKYKKEAAKKHKSDYIAIVIAKSPRNYKTTVLSTQQRLGSAVELEDIEKDMQMSY